MTKPVCESHSNEYKSINIFFGFVEIDIIMYKYRIKSTYSAFV